MNTGATLPMKTVLMLLLLTIPLLAAGARTQRIEGTTLSGSTGHIVTPSAGMLWPQADFTTASGYSLVAVSGKTAHIPFVQIGLFDQLELTGTLDAFDGSYDLLTGVKWRFSDSGTTEAAIGFVSQVIDVTENREYGGQVYAVSTFEGALFDYPALTSVLIGYTFADPLKSDIDFSVGFDAPLLPSVFADHLRFVFDVGNVSYSMNPSGNDENRGIVNAGFRVNPISVTDRLRFSGHMYGLDLLDGSDRSFAAGISLQMHLGQ